MGRLVSTFVTDRSVPGLQLRKFGRTELPLHNFLTYSSATAYYT